MRLAFSSNDTHGLKSTFLACSGGAMERSWKPFPSRLILVSGHYRYVVGDAILALFCASTAEAMLSMSEERTCPRPTLEYRRKALKKWFIQQVLSSVVPNV